MRKNMKHLSFWARITSRGTSFSSVICLVANSTISFFFIVESSSVCICTTYTYVYVFIFHSLAGGHLICLYFLGIVNRAVMNMNMQVFL